MPICLFVTRKLRKTAFLFEFECKSLNKVGIIAQQPFFNDFLAIGMIILYMYA